MDGLPKLHVGPGGWVQVMDLDGYPGALVRFYRREDGRLRPDAAILDAFESGLDSRKLRSFPLADVETAANLPEYATTISNRLAEETTLTLEGIVSGERFRSVRRRTRRVGAVGLRLPKRDGHGGYGDGFYERVALVYRGLVEHRPDLAPAQTIAEANDVPVTTVHRWIREARRRKLLAPARTKGKAG